MQTTELDTHVPRPQHARSGAQQNRPDTGHRQQELFVLVDAAVGGADRVRHPVQRSPHSARPARHRRPHRRLFRRRPGAGADRRRYDDLGRLAICEYLAEQFPRRAPVAAGRGRARDGALRSAPRCIPALPTCAAQMSMNIRASLPGQGRTPEAQADIGRICEIWENCLANFGHHQFLFGDFSIADAFYAPVVMRFQHLRRVAGAGAAGLCRPRAGASGGGALGARSAGRNRSDRRNTSRAAIDLHARRMAAA